MKIISGSKKVPVIYTAHHASHNFGHFDSRVALTSEQKIRFSDYGTAITVPVNGISTIVAEHSRALGDLNRDPDDKDRFQLYDYAKPNRNPIWKTGQELNDVDKQFCQENFYEPFHSEIVKQLSNRSELTFVVAWDNTAHYEIGKDSKGNSTIMKPIILSNRGAEESAESNGNEQTGCDPEFLKILSNVLVTELKAKELPHEVHLNLVMRGGYICRTYSTRRNQELLKEQGITCEVQSLQVEYDTLITHDQDTLEPKPEKVKMLQLAFNEAFDKAFREYLPIIS